jgi:hypothetical protein
MKARQTDWPSVAMWLWLLWVISAFGSQLVQLGSCSWKVPASEDRNRCTRKLRTLYRWKPLPSNAVKAVTENASLCMIMICIKCSHELCVKCQINPIPNPNPVYNHSLSRDSNNNNNNKGGTYIEGVWEQGVEENIWIEEKWSDWRLEKTA